MEYSGLQNVNKQKIKVPKLAAVAIPKDMKEISKEIQDYLDSQRDSQ